MEMQDISRPLQDRVDWVDQAKGAMIILVVFGHAWRGLARSDLVPPEIFATVDSRIYAFHMPVFFALSGWFLTASLRKVTAMEFCKSRLQRLLWPMIIWTYIFLGIKALAGQHTNSPVRFEDILVFPVPGVLHMWFLWALLLLSIAFSLLKPFSTDGKTWASVLWIAAGLVAALQVVSFGPEVARWIGPAIWASPFFLLGVIAGERGYLQNTSLYPRLLCAAVFLALLSIWPVVLRNDLGLPGSLLLTSCLIVVFSNSGRISASKTGRYLAFLGAASLPIYLSHTVFSASSRICLLVFNVDAPAVHIVVGTILGLLGPLALLSLANRAGATRLLGLQRVPPISVRPQ